MTGSFRPERAVLRLSGGRARSVFGQRALGRMSRPRHHALLPSAARMDVCLTHRPPGHVDRASKSERRRGKPDRDQPGHGRDGRWSSGAVQEGHGTAPRSASVSAGTMGGARSRACSPPCSPCSSASPPPPAPRRRVPRPSPRPSTSSSSPRPRARPRPSASSSASAARSATGSRSSTASAPPCRAAPCRAWRPPPSCVRSAATPRMKVSSAEETLAADDSGLSAANASAEILRTATGAGALSTRRRGRGRRAAGLRRRPGRRPRRARPAALRGPDFSDERRVSSLARPGHLRPRHARRRRDRRARSGHRLRGRRPRRPRRQRQGRRRRRHDQPRAGAAWRSTGCAATATATA